MKRKRLIAAVACLILCLTGLAVAEEISYQTLCSQEGLQSSEVIAWIEIPGASFCKPIMRHSENDAYYAKHDAHGVENEYGSLYVQAGYNAADFSDPVTMVYGNSSSQDAPLGMLQQMYSGSFDEYSQIILYTPDGRKDYIVFAAVPYTSIHVLHYYDFSMERKFNSFFDSVFSTRALAMHLDEDNRPIFGQDHVLILSTGLRGDPLRRYLVMAREAGNDLGQ